MPQVLPLVVALGAKALGASALVAGALSLGTSLLVSGYAQSKAKKKQRAEFNAAQVDRLANVVTSIAPRELVLGRVRKGGTVSFRGSAGQFKEYFLFHMCLAGHEIDGIEQVYLNDVPVTLDAEGYVQTAPYLLQGRQSTGQVVAGPITAGQVVTLTRTPIDGIVSAHSGSLTTESTSTWAEVAVSVSGNEVTFLQNVTSSVSIAYQYLEGIPNARIWWHLGGGTAVADARTKELFPDLWTDDHRGQGVARLFAQFRYNETSFPSGIVTVTVRLRGAKVYDPRSSLTVHTENPALLARHVYQHPYFGKATVSSDEDDRFIAAANACEVLHDYVVDGVTDTEPLYVAGLVAAYGTPAASVLDDLCAAMAGDWAYAGGELYIRAGVYTAPVMSLTEADLATVQRDGESETQDAISISPHGERVEKFNVVNLRIWDGGQEFKQVPLSPVKSSALIARDGGELAMVLDLPAVSFAPQAQHIAGVLMRDARDPLTVQASFKMKAYPLQIFDVVSLTVARYGWVAKTFEVRQREWDRQRGIVRLTLKETAAAIFTPDAEFLPQGYADNTALPMPWDIEPPVLSSAGVFSGTDELVALADGTVLTRVRVTWPQLEDLTITAGGQVEIQWAPVGTSVWQSVLVDGTATQGYIVGARDGTAIVLRARSRNAVAVSDWCPQITHIVVGKTTPPAPVERFKLIEQPGGTKQFFWDVTSPEADLASFVVRYSLGSTERPWDEMISLFAKGKNAREHETTEPRQDDTYTFAICAVDTSGNVSEPVYITETLDGDLFGGVALIVLPHELDWPGTKTDCYVAGALLVDAGTATWNDVDVEWNELDIEWNELVGGGPAGTIVYEHSVIDTGSAVARTIRANSLAAGSAVIEYASSADDITYSAWAPVPNGTVTDRYFKFRWTVTGPSPILYRAQVVFYV
jgi:hypothetical protein